jgi:hypothetical protein
VRPVKVASGEVGGVGFGSEMGEFRRSNAKVAKVAKVATATHTVLATLRP